MAQPQSLRKDAQAFVIRAITELNGERPSQAVVKRTAERIVKALTPAVTQASGQRRRNGKGHTS